TPSSAPSWKSTMLRAIRTTRRRVCGTTVLCVRRIHAVCWRWVSAQRATNHRSRRASASSVC
ncbi:hypothetical protein LPJ73_008237, partial [Coemansia sp. RSA 2703]